MRAPPIENHWLKELQDKALKYGFLPTFLLKLFGLDFFTVFYCYVFYCTVTQVKISIVMPYFFLNIF